MDIGAGAFLRRTITLVLSSSLLLIFWRIEDKNKDIESQNMTLLRTLEDESGVVQNRDSDGPMTHAKPSSMRSICSINDRAVSDTESSQLPRNLADEPSRVIVHQETPEKECLAMLITDSMVSHIQEVIDDNEELKRHKKQFECIGNEIETAQDRVERARESLAAAADDQEYQDCQDVLDHQESILTKACEQRDELSPRLRIFEMNVTYAQKASQAYFEDILGKASLLKLPQDEVPQNDYAPMADMDHETTRASSKGDQAGGAEELLRRATDEKLTQLSQDFEEAQQLFSGMEAKYERDEAMYDEAVAEGEEVPTRSEFDRMFLKYKMGLTTYLIDIEQKYEEERANAIALGVVASDWGTPSEYGSYTAESSPENDIIKAAGRDYTTLLAWMDDVPNLDKAGMAVNTDLGEDNTFSVERMIHSESIPEPTGMDEWDAKPVEISDSISLIDFGEITGKNIRRWQNQVGHR